MSNVHVEAARIPDRDRLLAELREAGLQAHPIDELEIEVRPDGGHGLPEEVFSRVETMVFSLGAPFVPIKHEDVIYIRPPVS